MSIPIQITVYVPDDTDINDFHARWINRQLNRRLGALFEAWMETALEGRIDLEYDPPSASLIDVTTHDTEMPRLRAVELHAGDVITENWKPGDPSIEVKPGEFITIHWDPRKPPCET